MDYLDPKKEQRHQLLLFVGYASIAVAIAMTAMVLLYQAYGFGLNKKGDVIQNGLAFFSSQPNPANIYINGKLSKYATDTRVALPSGIYRIELTRDGYNTWKRTIEIEGGGVQHFDYPFLIPKALKSSVIKTFVAAPGMSTQSPDRRWLLVQQPNSVTSYDVFDLKSPDKPPTTITLPANVLTKANSNQSITPVSWASDNDHVLLQHLFDGRSEYILLSRSSPEQSQNLNIVLSSNPTKLTLLDKKFDKYYLFDQSTGVIQTATLSQPKPVAVLEKVLAYQSYGSDTLLYVTSDGAPTGKVVVKLKIGNQTYVVRTLPIGSTYLLDLTKYSNDLYVAAGASNQDKVYIYKDPVGQIKAKPKQAPAPIQVLHVTSPNYLSFSSSAQFIMIENGSQFGVYDIENERGYNFLAPEVLDAPALHATWMDGNRLTYVSSGKQLIFDFDHTNPQILPPASSNYLPAFSPDYKFIYTLRNGTIAGQVDLSQTSLRTPADK